MVHLKEGNKHEKSELVYLQPHLYTISRLMRLCVNFYLKKEEENI